MSTRESVFTALESVLREQARRWREVLTEGPDERVEALAIDALDNIERLQDAMLVGHFQDALDA
jgi:hypothetical protein